MKETHTMSRASDLVVPTDALVATSAQLVHQLRPGVDRYALTDLDTGSQLPLPNEIAVILRDILVLLAQNKAVAVGSVDLELTTNQAADVLNVSRTFVIRLIEKGDLPHRLVGTHRRIRLEDALSLRDRMRLDAEAAIGRITQIGQELGLDD
jgi:excisionase family DNA binding protein